MLSLAEVISCHNTRALPPCSLHRRSPPNLLLVFLTHGVAYPPQHYCSFSIYHWVPSGMSPPPIHMHQPPLPPHDYTTQLASSIEARDISLTCVLDQACLMSQLRHPHMTSLSSVPFNFFYLLIHIYFAQSYIFKSFTSLLLEYNLMEELVTQLWIYVLSHLAHTSLKSIISQIALQLTTIKKLTSNPFLFIIKVCLAVLSALFFCSTKQDRQFYKIFLHMFCFSPRPTLKQKLCQMHFALLLFSHCFPLQKKL